MEPARTHDVLIVGAGPSGSTAALLLASAGVDVAVVERAPFPRFAIGESFLPGNWRLIERLGLTDAVYAGPHTVKRGAEFVFGSDGQGCRFRFGAGPDGREQSTVNLPRAEFDALLLDRARAAGAQVVQPAAVRRIARLADGDVELDTDAGTLRGRWLIDASGPATLVARHAGLRRPADEPHLRKAAFFEHFEDVERLPGEEAGFPTIVMCEEGWFWLIPLDERRTSVGLVLEPAAVRRAGVPADRLLAWGVERCAPVRARLARARGPAANRACADFSYRCRPYAVPGAFLVGDAALFLDPVFSSGVCLGMMGAEAAANAVRALLDGTLAPEAARRRHAREIERPSRTFARFIARFYDPAFRDLFMNGSGPFGVHRAALEVLAGNVFPAPRPSVRWRLRLLDGFVRLHRRVALVPRHPGHSLLSATPAG